MKSKVFFEIPETNLLFISLQQFPSFICIFLALLSFRWNYVNFLNNLSD